MRLMTLSDPLSYAFCGDFLAARLMYLALPHFVSVRPRSARCALRRALPCSTAALALRPRALPRDAAHRKHAVRRPPRSAVWRTWRRAKGARARARARCGRTYAQEDVGRAGEYERGTRAAGAESRRHFR